MTQGSPLSPYLFNVVHELLATATQWLKEIKQIQIRKQEVQVSIFADYMIVYISEPKTLTREPLQLIYTLNKVCDTLEES